MYQASPRWWLTAGTQLNRESTPHARAGSCVVDVSDWPIGILPDDASAAFGPTVLAACVAAVADWPSGALPEDPFSLFRARRGRRCPRATLPAARDPARVEVAQQQQYADDDLRRAATSQARRARPLGVRLATHRGSMTIAIPSCMVGRGGSPPIVLDRLRDDDSDENGVTAVAERQWRRARIVSRCRAW